jgi:hypothetical protein
MMDFNVFVFGVAACVLCLALAQTAFAASGKLTLDCRTRDASNKVVMTSREIDPAHTAVIVIDPWNYHWCMTACERVGAMTPRWNAALDAARKLGMQVMWAPSDVASMYSGTTQRERALAVPYVPVPKVRDLTCSFTCAVGPCMCGPGLACQGNYGHDGMCGDLVVAQSDWIVCGLEEVYAICKQQGITNIIFMGLHTNMCLFGKPDALKPMYGTGIDCYVTRDINDAFTHYEPAAGFTPDDGTAWIDDDLERAGVPLIYMADEMRKAGLWDDEKIVETVRITPWGKPYRPYLFEKGVDVSLTAPWLKDVQIRYTLDGSEPTANSPRYEKPVHLTRTATLRTAAFRDGKKVSLDTDAYFAAMPPLPPAPDVTLDQVTPVTDLYAVIGPVYATCLWPPVMNKSYDNQPLSVRATVYDKGVGMRAPAYLRYQVDPKWDRFVALAGIDDNMLKVYLGRNIASAPSVVFQVFVDGKFAAASPVMRISQEPWRFDVNIPKGSRVITMVASDGGKHSPYNLGNWVKAGFVVRK